MAEKLYAIIDYEDDYVQPLILSALRNHTLPESLVLVSDLSDLPSHSVKLLQWRQYESIDFTHLLSHPHNSLANSYIIRKALIRKHYLSATVAHWRSKRPESILKDHFKPGTEFELDYAEFLDDALLEAWELKKSWESNETRLTEGGQLEWWILKPGMSDRGQGIRLFSSEEQLREIFEGWDPGSDDEDEDHYENGTVDSENDQLARKTGCTDDLRVMTSHLRHFVAQPYIHPPLLLREPHSCAGRKFHIRSYVVAVGALQVYVYRPMLALFADQPYCAPSVAANEHLHSHLTNTCLQNEEREDSVQAFWSLPGGDVSPQSLRCTGGDWRKDVFEQICGISSEIFLGAVRTMSFHFQPLPNAFEIFALDFLLDDQATAWLLEVNAFPDFRQTGEKLKGLVQGLFDETVKVIAPLSAGTFPVTETGKTQEHGIQMIQVLDIDLGRR